MIRPDTPYIVAPMTAMDKMLHMLLIFREGCPEHLRDDLDFALKRFKETALYMHGKDNQNVKAKPTGYDFKKK